MSLDAMCEYHGGSSGTRNIFYVYQLNASVIAVDEKDCGNEHDHDQQQMQVVVLQQQSKVEVDCNVDILNNKHIKVVT